MGRREIPPLLCLSDSHSPKLSSSCHRAIRRAFLLLHLTCTTVIHYGVPLEWVMMMMMMSDLVVDVIG